MEPQLNKMDPHLTLDQQEVLLKHHSLLTFYSRELLPLAELPLLGLPVELHSLLLHTHSHKSRQLLQLWLQQLQLQQGSAPHLIRYSCSVEQIPDEGSLKEAL